MHINRLPTYAAVALVVVIATGCGPAADPKVQQRIDAEQSPKVAKAADMITGKPWPQTQFERATIPGTAEQAKAAGFTDCKVRELSFGHKVVSCRREDTHFMGLKLAGAEVELDAGNNLNNGWFDETVTEARDTTGKSLDQLSYAGVTYYVASAPIDQACLSKRSIMEADAAMRDCRNSVTVADVVAKLKADGWKTLPISRGMPINVDDPYGPITWAKRGAQVKIRFLAGQPYSTLTGFRVVPADPTDIAPILDELEATQRAEASAQAADQALIDQMKSSK